MLGQTIIHRQIIKNHSSKSAKLMKWPASVWSTEKFDKWIQVSDGPWNGGHLRFTNDATLIISRQNKPFLRALENSRPTPKHPLKPSLTTSVLGQIHSTTLHVSVPGQWWRHLLSHDISKFKSIVRMMTFRTRILKLVRWLDGSHVLLAR